MTDPFLIEGPACISFSGGRTSAYMLRRILDSHGGVLPEDVHVLFANTGKERPETLDFVHEIETRWNVRVRWLEWRVLRLEIAGRLRKVAPARLVSTSHNAGLVRMTFERVYPLRQFKWTETWREVSYDTASRKGEPFAELIDWKRYLPNAVQRICTQHLKIETLKTFAICELGLDEWDAVIGIRYDEPRRWRILGRDPRNQRETKIAPLVEARVDVADVMRFWATAPFDLRLMSHEGNCDLCFLKGRARLDRMIRASPQLADWWIEQENKGLGKKVSGGRFRSDRPAYEEMRDQIERSPLLPFFSDTDDDTRPCTCTD